MHVPKLSLGVAFAAVAAGAIALSLAGAGPAASPAKGAASKALLARGQYIATVAGCNDCHTPGALFGAPDFKRQFAGSELGWKGPWGVTFAKNLTPDLETGLGYWSDAELERALRTGVKNDGTQLLPPMPWQDFAGLSPADMQALIAYLRSVPPISHKVPDTVPPGQAYSGATLEFPPPPAWDAPAGAAKPQ